MLVTLIGLTAMAAVRAERIASETTIDMAKARLYAESAIELAQELISSDANWRSSRVSGAWATSQPIGDGSFTLQVVDAVDGNLANRPTDPVVVTATGIRGSATQHLQVTLTATGQPIGALSAAVQCAGELHISSAANLTVTDAAASSNTTFRSQGTLTGSVECLTITLPGTVTGTTTILAPSKTMPDSGIVALYSSLATAVPTSATMERFVLGPGYNPWGAASTDGVYLISSSSDFTIRNCRVNGTLVISCPGKTVTIAANVLLQPARADFPALIVDGNLVLAFDSAGALAETSSNTNFNPAGAPYSGASDSDTSDSYPSEIQGLVHARGVVKLDQTSRVRGALISESTALLSAIDVSGTPQVIYDANLVKAPPMGYTTNAAMAVQAGSWKQVVY
jgi:Tfp pilus assembly protein PilX